MAIFHMNVKAIGRSTGRSSTGTAAYRAGEKITDLKTGEEFDYSRKREIDRSEDLKMIFLPEGGKANRAEFWNKVEFHHKRADAVLVREVEVSLPVELTQEQSRQLAILFAKDMATRYGVGADCSIHTPKGNPHAHISLSACHSDRDGNLGKKAVELDPIHCQRAKIENLADQVRGDWADRCNAALAEHGHHARIDCRTLEAQGIDREPTRHKGVAVSAMERRGIETRVGQRIAAAHAAGEAERAKNRETIATSSLAAALRERDLNARNQRTAPPVASVSDLRSVHGSDSVFDLRIPEMLLQQDAPADVRQQAAKPNNPHLLKPDPFGWNRKLTPLEPREQAKKATPEKKQATTDGMSASELEAAYRTKMAAYSFLTDEKQVVKDSLARKDAAEKKEWNAATQKHAAQDALEAHQASRFGPLNVLKTKRLEQEFKDAEKAFEAAAERRGKALIDYLAVCKLARKETAKEHPEKLAELAAVEKLAIDKRAKEAQERAAKALTKEQEDLNGKLELQKAEVALKVAEITGSEAPAEAKKPAPKSKSPSPKMG